LHAVKTSGWVVAGLVAIGPAVAAPTHWIAEAESGDRIRAAGLGAAFRGFGELASGGAWRLSHHWKLGLSAWNSKRTGFRHDELWTAWTYNVLRVEMPSAGPVVPFAELGLGAHLLSKTRIHARRFSTAFQFGEQVALGVRFGPGHAYSVAARLAHVSNASIKSPNDGVTFTGVAFNFDWR
jgi:hypothetical protein